MTPSQLPETDCHHLLRNEILSNLAEPLPPICYSLAWDWQFCGITKNGIKKISQLAYNNALENREKRVTSLAIHETCLLRLANRLSHSNKNNLSKDDIQTILGILPTLKKIFNIHKKSYKKAKQSDDIEIIDKNSYSKDGEPKCSICRYELSNHYMLLTPESSFGFCMRCYLSEQYRESKKVKRHLREKNDNTLKLCHYYMPLQREKTMINTLKDYALNE